MKGPLVRLIKTIIDDMASSRVIVTSNLILDEAALVDQDTRHAFYHDINPNVTEFDRPASPEERMESRAAAMMFVVESMTIN